MDCFEVVEFGPGERRALLEHLEGQGLLAVYGSPLGMALESLQAEREASVVTAMREARRLLRDDGTSTPRQLTQEGLAALHVLDGALEPFGPDPA